MGDFQLLGNKTGFNEPHNQKIKDERSIVIQFGTLLEQMEENTTTFTLLKTFEAKEGHQIPSDEESKASKEVDPEVKYPKFTLHECDLIYSFEEPSLEMTKHIKPIFIKACLNGVVLNRVLVDNSVAVNIIPLSILKKINK